MFPRKVILRALVCLLLAMLPFPEQENELYDLKARILKRTHFQRPDSVLIVEVSKEDFEELRLRFGNAQKAAKGMLGPWREKFESIRTQFFWDDGVYEALLSRILKDNPQKLLVTFFYSESLVLLQDNPNLQKLARNSRVLWASQFDLDLKLLKPAPELTATENYGFTNLYPDSDGVVRRAYLVNTNHMSLPFRALLSGRESLQRGMPLTEPFLIRYAGAPGFIPTCRALELFDEPEKCGPLQDRFVILAPTDNTVAGASLFRTPVGYMGKGEVLANTLLTAKEESAYLTVSPYLLVLFVLGHVLAVAAAVLNRDGFRQLTLVLGLLLVEGILALAAMRFLSLQLPLMPFVAGTVSAYIAFLWLKIARQDEKRWQAEKKAQYLRELDELKSNFLSLMSHDLKTPIAKVQALTERLAREAQNLSFDHREILASIQRSNEELGQYILSILNFQRIESQELKPNKKSNDINVIIEDIVQRLEALAQDKGVQVKLELEPMFPAEFDEQQIRQVLNNLVDNAIKYNKPGTIVIVSSADLGDFLQVSVKDNGVGIEKDQMERLFKKFSRSEKGSSERVRGTGLGLYLAKYFIELHGGKIEVESKIGEGTSFRFTLPVS